MNYYDFAKAKQLILEHKETLIDASLGMAEDWFWTAETVYEDGEFKIDLDTIQTIGGIDKSRWATPTLRLSFPNDFEKNLPCYKHDN